MSGPLIVLLHGAVAADAPPDEQDGLVEVATVAAALAACGYRVERLALTLDLASARRRLQAWQPQLVFNLVTTVAGRGDYIHLAPALLEELGLPFTGAPLYATFTSSNKLAAKRLLHQAGLPTPAWREPDTVVDEAAGRWLVKSVWEHASIGLDDAALVDAPMLADRLAERHQRYGGRWFAERYIEGREFNLALLAAPAGWQRLPPAEILFRDYPAGKPRIVGYAAKWDEASFEYRSTPRRFDFPAADQPLLARLGQLALDCAGLFRLRGYARVDVRVDEHDQPWVLEVNTNPCLSPDAGFAAAAARAGLTLEQVIGRIVEAALAAPQESTQGTG